MAFPTLKVEIAFTTDPLAGTPAWTDVSSYIREIGIRRGRSRVMSRMETGTVDAVFDNRDRRFEPLNTGSPYSPNVIPGRRGRVRVTVGANTYDLTHFFVESWPPSYPDIVDAVTRVTGSDLFSLLARVDLQNPYVMEILKDEPSAYYRLNETGGTLATDSSGNRRHGTYLGGPTFSQADPITDDINGAVSFDGVDDQVLLPDSAALSGSTVSLECWIKHPTVISTPNNTWPLAQFLDGVSTSGTRFEVVRSGANIGKIAWLIDQANILISTGRVDDNAWHHIVATYDGITMRLYIDGVLVATLTVTTTVTARPIAIGGWPGGGDSAPDHAWDGLIDEVALYPIALSSARISSHYGARTAWLGDGTGARIGRVLDEVGVGIGDRILDTGQSTLQSEGGLAESALDHIFRATDSEAGLTWARRDGKLKFRERHAALKSPYNTSQATFGDGGGAEIPYSTITLSYDDLDIYNEVRVQRRGGVLASVRDSPSKTKYGTRTLLKTIYIESDLETYDAADWYLQHFKDPALRVESIGFVVTDNQTHADAIFSREIGDRVTIKRRPPGGGAAITQDAHIEGIDHSYQVSSKLWVVVWRLSPADQGYWLLDDAVYSVLGTTTRLAY